VLSWTRLTLISGFFLVIMTISCGVKAPPVNSSGPWGPNAGNTPTHDNGQIDAENQAEQIDSL
jgi:hypothetical protein